VLAHRAVSALNSGPAAGPSASLHYASGLGRSNVLTLDMGGTSTDISLAQDGRVDLIKDVDIGRYRVGIPLVNVISIGAGGGSIASLDGHGLLRVGPESAEAIPGPACYMRGGTEATVTDALVVLGYLNQKALLGGRMPIDADAAATAVTERIATQLRISRERAALGIFDVVNANMIGGIRSVSIERGHDPRDFCLVAGGGATSAHAGRLAAELGISEVVIPKVASGLCAFGEAVADVKHTYLASYTAPLPALDPRRLDKLFRALEEQGRRDLAEEGFAGDSVYVERTVDMKYIDQVHECRVEVATGAVDESFVTELAAAFHRRHEALYTYCEPDNVAELINVEVNVYGRSPRITPAREEAGKGVRAPAGERLAYFAEFGAFRPTPVIDGRHVATGAVVEGPSIVEEETTTIVVFPGWKLGVPRSDVYVMRSA
jgi:N-methylhydantoinase A